MLHNQGSQNVPVQEGENTLDLGAHFAVLTLLETQRKDVLGWNLWW